MDPNTGDCYIDLVKVGQKLTPPTKWSILFGFAIKKNQEWRVLQCQCQGGAVNLYVGISPCFIDFHNLS